MTAALVLEAEAFAETGAYTAACDAYERALPTLTGLGARIRVFAGLSFARTAAGDPERGLAAGLEALALHEAQPDDQDARLQIIEGFIGNALMALGRHGDACAHYENAWAAQQRCEAGDLAEAATLNALGEATGRLGDFTAAQYYQETALQRLCRALPEGHRDIALAMTNLGVSLYRNDRAEQAERILRKALDIDPSLILAAENLIHVLYKQGRKPEGRALAQQKYRQQSFVVQKPPANARGTALLLWSLDGTVPHHHLLAGLPMGLVDWHIEYADATHEQRLPPYDIVLNLIGDADQGEAALAAARDFQSRCTRPILNDPRRIETTNRDKVAAHLAGIEGLVIPGVRQIAAGEAQTIDPAGWLAEHGFLLPILFRTAGTHGGESVRLLPDVADFAASLDSCAPDEPAYVTQFHDYAAADGLFRKYRAIFVDRRPYPYHLAISPHWLVHYFSAEMAGETEKQREELRFLADMPGVLGAKAMTALGEIGRRMDLDYCGIDFSLLPDGSVLFFESNATMLVHPEDAEGELSAKNPYITRIIEDFQKVILGKARQDGLF